MMWMASDWRTLNIMKPVPLKQVALLFLTTGALFHERSWALWFSQAADLLPLHCLLQSTNGSAGTPRMAARNSLVDNANT